MHGGKKMHNKSLKKEPLSVKFCSCPMHAGACSRHFNNSPGAAFFLVNYGTHFISIYYVISGIKFSVLRLN